VKLHLVATTTAVSRTVLGFRARALRLVRAAGLVCLAGFSTLTSRADDWAPNLTVHATWHDNASNAESSADQIDSLALGTDILSSQRYKLGNQDVFQLTGHFAGEWWPRYADLLGGAVGARAAWLHTFGAGNLAPVVSAEIGGDLFESRESGRRGAAAALTLALRKRFNDQWRGAITQQFDRRYARAAVFDQEATETTIELSYDLTDVARLTLGALYRDGDVVTYSGNPRGEVAAIASAQRELDTFGRPMTAYSVDARTWGAKVSVVRALDESSAIIASYAWSSTEGKPVQFMNQRLSIAIVTQF